MDYVTMHKKIRDPKMKSEASNDDKPDSKEGQPSVKKRPQTKFVKLKSNKAPKNPKQTKQNKRTRLIVLLTALITFVIISIVVIYLVVLPLQRINSSVQNIQSNISELMNEFKQKDLSNIDAHVESIQADLTKVNAEIDRYEFLSNWDQTKGYYENFQIARGILKKSSDLLDTTLPELKNILKATGFNTDKVVPVSAPVTTPAPTAADAKGDSAVSLVMKELPQYLALYDSIEPKINDILLDIKKINPDYVPNVGGYDFKGKLAKLNDFVDAFPDTSVKTKNFLKNIPNLVGSNKPTRFLLVLQNETEMRSSGGLLTAYGHLELKNGEIGDVFLSDMWNLQRYIWELQATHYGINIPYENIYGQDFLMNHGCGATELRAQDAGIYPDLYVTADMIKTYYDYAKKYNPKEYPDYDYVLILDHNFASTLIGLVQPLVVPGYGPVTPDNLYDVIKSETDDPKHHGDPNRKSILKEIANVAKANFQNLSVKDIPNIIQSMIKSVQAKDISISTFKDPEMQKYFDQYGLSARTVKDFKGDYFQMSEAQNCALKLNRWLRDSVDQTINIDASGKIKKEVYARWVQPQVYSDALLGQYSASYNFWYRAWVRIFMPKDSKSITSDGLKKSGTLYYRPVTYYDKIMGETASDNVIYFDHRRLKESDPIPSVDLNVKYELPDSINYNKDGKYRVLIQKHPGKSWGEPYKVTINHKGGTYSVQFYLDRDKVVTYQDGVIQVDNYDKKLDWIIDLVHEVPWDKV